jgi:hypothetical protein
MLRSRRPKGGSSSRPRADLANRCGGSSTHPCDGGARRRVGFPAGMVAVAQGPSGARQALPQRPSCPPPRGNVASTAITPRDGRSSRGRTRANERPSYRRRVGNARTPLLPSQKPPLGRSRRDHRTMLGAMLWVLGSGSSWRDLPEEEFGPWQTVYARYRKWCREGLWQRIMEVLDS